MSTITQAAISDLAKTIASSIPQQPIRNRALERLGAASIAVAKGDMTEALKICDEVSTIVKTATNELTAIGAVRKAFANGRAY
jgi:hypothetical protein